MRRITTAALAATLLSALTLLAGAAPAGAQMVPYIVGGQKTEASSYPWQVYVNLHVLSGSQDMEISCGGSILDSTHILTAAHCVDQEGTTVHYPASDIKVYAGLSSLKELEGSGAPKYQVKHVLSYRVHPDYSPLPNIRDDVAVLTLEAPLALEAAKNTAAIGLVAPGATPAAGTTLSVSGFGKENGLEGEGEAAQPDGNLYSTTLTAIGSDPCRTVVGANSAVLLCAASATSSACEGDSGGPLTQGSPAVEVGVVDFGGKSCPVGGVNVFTNLAAPEIRSFIEGSESPPLAARPTAVPPTLKTVGASPVDYSPITCEPGGWDSPAAFAYTFETEGTAPQVLQSGPSNVFVPASGAVGYSLVCVVQAANAGGVSTARSAGTAGVTLDTAAPSARIAGRPRCHLQACTLTISASDPNAVALTLKATASYPYRTTCKVTRHHHRTAVPCTRTRSLPMSLSSLAAGSYKASVSRLPYGQKVRFAVLAHNAAGLSQSSPSATSATLSAPRKKAKKH